MMPSQKDLLARFAATISRESLGLVRHAPDSAAQPMHCIQNVLEKVSRAGGRPVYGWAFLSRVSPLGRYLIAMHHSVWQAPYTTEAVDITPFHEDVNHRPYCPVDGSIAFLLDDAAQPKSIGHAIVPLASRFFPADDDPKLAVYVDELNRKEQADCQKLGAGALAAHLVSQRPN